MINSTSHPYLAVFLAVESAAIFYVTRPAFAQESSDVTLDAANLEIDQSGSPGPSDSFQIETTFTNTEHFQSGKCDGDDPVAQGLTITLGTGSCGRSTGVVMVSIPAFSPTKDPASKGTVKSQGRHRKHQKHFVMKIPVIASDPSTGETENASLDAEITVLPTPPGTCGRWNLDAEVSNLDLSALTTNPVVVTIGQGDDSGCNDQIQAQFDNDDNQGDEND